MAKHSSLLLTFFSSLLVSSVNAQGYYGQPPPPAYSYGYGNPGNGDGGTTLTIPGGPTIIIPGPFVVPTGPGGIPTSQVDGEVTTHLTSTLPVTIQTTVQACAISVSLVTSLQIHTVSYVTTETIVQSITSSVCQLPPTTSLPSPTLVTDPPFTTLPPSATTCVTGSPVTTGGYTITYVKLDPTPYVANYVPDLTWETGGYGPGHLIGSENFYFDHQFQAYAEFKCQFQCTGTCEGWFVAYNTTGNYWKCLQYNALIPGTVLVPPPADAPFVSGVAYNNLCGPKPTLTPPITDIFPTTIKPVTPTSSNDGVVTTKSTTPSVPPYNPSTSDGPGSSGGPGTGSTAGPGYPTSSHGGGTTSAPTLHPYTPHPYNPITSGGDGTSGGPGKPTSSYDGAFTTKTTATQSPHKPPTTSPYKPTTTLPPLPYYGNGPPPPGYGNPTTLKTSTKPGYPVASPWHPYDFSNLGNLGGEKREEQKD